MQIVKAAIYPNKVRRHWDHPLQVHFLGFIPVNWIVLVILLGDEIDQASYSVLTVRPRAKVAEFVACQRVPSEVCHWVSLPSVPVHVCPGSGAVQELSSRSP